MGLGASSPEKEEEVIKDVTAQIEEVMTKVRGLETTINMWSAMITQG